MTSREGKDIRTRLRSLLDGMDGKVPAAADAGEIRDVLEEAARELEGLAGRERVYRETVRQQNRDFDRKILEMSVLRQVGDIIAGSLKLDDVLDQVLDILVREFRVENSSVLILDEDTGDLRLEAGRGPGAADGRRPLPASIRVGEGIAGWVAASREALIVNDISTDVRFQHVRGGDGANGSLVCVPLVAEDGVLGVLNLSISATGYFDPHHVHILEIVASQIAGALIGRQLFRELRDLSSRLEDEVKQRTEELRRRTADLRRKNEQVTQLYSSLENAQRELEQRNQRLVEALLFNDNIVETVNVGIIVTNHGRKIRTWNRAMAQLAGQRVTKEQAIGASLESLPEDFRDRFGLGESLMDALVRARPVTVRDHVVDRADGKRLHLNVHHLPVAIAGEPHPHVITVIEDVTSNVALHEQRVRSERLAAITETMVSVNHEVNNPLGVILGYAQMQLLKRAAFAADARPPDEWVDETVRRLGTIESEAVRIREITRKLSSLVEPVVTPYLEGEGVRMVDVNQSR